MRPNPSLSEIAAEAGVSRYTVSLALRQSPRVSDDSRRKVELAAKKLGYRPNPTLSALMRSIRWKGRQHRLTSLALVMMVDKPQWTGKHRYLADITSGAKARCEEAGFAFERFLVEPGRPNARHLQHVLDSRGVDGVIIAPLPKIGSTLGLNYDKLAYVSIGQTLTEVPTHRMETATFLNIRKALTHAMELGWRRPGLMLSNRMNDALETMVLGAYLGFLHGRGADHPPPLIFDERELSRDMVADWIRRHEVDAVLTSRSIVATWLREAGFRLGEDVALAHLDCPADNRELAGINQRLHEVGASAVDVLGELIHANARGVPAVAKIVEIEGEWRDGASMPPRPGFQRRP